MDTKENACALCVRAGFASVPPNHPEIDSLLLERPEVGVGDVLDVERPVADLCADVACEVNRAVQIEVDEVRGRILHEILQELEPGELTGDGDVRDNVETADAAKRRNRRP